MKLFVKDSGIKASPHSDFREGKTKKRSDMKVRIGTWNVRTLLQGGKLENAKEEMKKNKLDILGMSEVRWGGSGEIESGEYKMYFSGQERSGKYGVGILVGKRMNEKVLRIEYINERIIMVRFKGKNKDLVIIQVYMPTSQHEDEEVEELYDMIEDVVKKEKKNANIIIMGDWNAIVGEGEDGKTVGKFGLGKRNERGQRLVEFCKENEMVVGNTVFEVHKRRRYTWRSSFDSKRYQIDYIMVQQRYRNGLKSAKSYPGADICSDHNLVVAEIYMKMKKVIRGKRIEKLAIEKLKGENTEQIERVFTEKMKQSGNSECINEKWEKIKDTLKEAAKSTIGMQERKRTKKEWVTEEMICKMDERRKWKNVETVEGKVKYRRLNNELRRETERAREIWLRDKCNEMERLRAEGRYDQMYKEAKDFLFTGRKGGGQVVESKEGVLLQEPQEIKERWKEYLEDLYDCQNKPGEEEIKEEDEGVVAEDEKGPPLLESEILKSLKEMRNKKANGCDDIPVELWKAMEGEGKKILIDLCRQIYEEGKWPKDFRNTVMIPIPKKKNTRNCEEYRTISLITHTAKILLRTINRRIYEKLNRDIREEQFGFRRGVGTRDAIGLLRMIGERYIEKNRKVYVIFVDMEKAFDRVKWDKMMVILKKYGIDWRERRLIKELYMNQKARVRIGVELTEEIDMGRGVRQGCNLSPTLFNIYLEEIMKESFDGTKGVNIGGRHIEGISFADDMAVVAENAKVLREMLQKLDIVSKRYGMKINVNKTKSMVIGRGEENLSIQLEGELIEQVQHFKYLGSVINKNGNCTEEVKIRIARAKENFNKRRRLFCGPLEKELRKSLMKCYIWSVMLYGAETWTLRREEERKLEAMEMWIWRRMEGVRWEERVRNEEVLRRVGEGREILGIIKSRKANWLGHVMRRECLLRTVIEGKVRGKRGRGRRRYQMMDNIMIRGKYETTKRLAQEREDWRNAAAGPV